jgi:DNA invertase Pin-like site-specific DNA recombinase
VHLVVGTQLENVHDAITRGRHKRPPRWELDSHPRAKLNLDSAQQIRRRLANGETIAAIAREYGTGESTIRHLRDRRTWRVAA